MANTVSPRGFTPVKLDHHDVHRYYKSAAGVLTVGDPVVRSTASNDPLGYGTVIRASTGSAITGVVVSFEIDANRTYDYLASADVGYVMVADNPFQEFYVQDNGGAAGIPITALGLSLIHISFNYYFYVKTVGSFSVAHIYMLSVLCIDLRLLVP